MIKFLIIDYIPMFVQIVSFNKVDVIMMHSLQMIFNLFILGLRKHRSDEDNFDSIDSFMQIVLILFGFEIAELGGMIRMDLFDEGADTHRET